MQISDKDLAQSVESSLQHHSLVRARRDRLSEQMDMTAAQVARRIGSAYGAGRVTYAELVVLFFQYREAIGAGYTKHWNDNLPHSSADLMAAANNGVGLPNGPDGSFHGKGRPMGKEPCPPRGHAVVYVLYDEKWDPIYVGSTGQFRERIKRHASPTEGKGFTFWRAWPCADRADAYRREGEMLEQVMPKLNRRAETRFRSKVPAEGAA